jgi:hypothetical protein
LFVATATPPGIAGPPRTPQATEPPRERSRAEAFLRRIAPSEADLPPGFGKPETSFKDASQLATLRPDPAAERDRWDRAGLVLSYESSFGSEAGEDVPPEGVVREVGHIGYAFATAEGADALLDETSAQLATTAQALIDQRTAGVQVERIEDLRLGDETVAWRVSGPSEALPNVEVVAWAIAVRRGAASYVLTLHGAGPAVDRLARDLAPRLDQRLAAAVPSAWP